MHGRENMSPFLFKLVTLAASLSLEMSEALNKVYSFIITLLKIYSLLKLDYYYLKVTGKVIEISLICIQGQEKNSFHRINLKRS